MSPDRAQRRAERFAQLLDTLRVSATRNGRRLPSDVTAALYSLDYWSTALLLPE